VNSTQTASTATPVINFATANSDRKSARRASKQPDHPDADLIAACIEYATQVHAGQIAYKIDPTDAKFASVADTVQILDLPPRTMDGMRAKAAIVEMALEDWTCDLDDLRQSFIITLANDVIRFQRASRGLNQHDTVVVVPR
jgi:(p)ppGpp synthase/HD superfamily hydrolase